jgi:Protein of unknown function (DUF3455)
MLNLAFFCTKSKFEMKSKLSSIAIGSIALAVVGCASMGGASKHPISVPDAIRAAANESYGLALPAKGVQIYECKAAADGKLGWAFVAPEADLFDLSGKLVGKHYAGPTWEMLDGSKIVGTVKSRADASAPNAIPWLLLTAKSTGGAGQLANVTSLQRVNTIAGVAPTEPCSAANVGAKARVPYTADYYYFVAK